MGFGWLLIGYFTATMMSLNTLGGLFSLVGFSLAAYGAKKLSDYNFYFRLLFFSGLLLIPISALVSFSDVNRFLYDFMLLDRVFIGEAALTVISYVKYAAELVFTVLLCYSVASIAKETGEKKIVYLGIRNLVISCVYYAVLVLGWIPAEPIREFAKAIYLPVWTLVLCVAVVILNSLMLFSCYTKICDESDVDMPAKPRKPSRFAFVNELRAERDRRVEKAMNETQKKEKPSAYSDEQQRRSAASAKKKRKNR